MLDWIAAAVAARIVHADDADDDAVVAVAVAVVHGEGSERMLDNGGSNWKKLQQRTEKRSGSVEASGSLKHGVNHAAPYLSLSLNRSGEGVD